MISDIGAIDFGINELINMDSQIASLTALVHTRAIVSLFISVDDSGLVSCVCCCWAISKNIIFISIFFFNFKKNLLAMINKDCMGDYFKMLLQIDYGIVFCI